MPPVPPDRVHRLELPTPFRVGPVSCWLLDGDPLTLVDPGPRSAEARVALDRALTALGRRVEEVEQVVLTHQHHDHVGLAEEVRARSGARVAATAMLARYLADYERGMDRNDAYAAALMARHGIDRETAETLDGVSRSFRHYSGGSPVDTLLEPGGELAAGGRRWRVHERPGHSPTDTVLHDERERLLIGGDHVLERSSSSPVGHAPVDDRDPREVAAGAGRPRPLVDLVASLRATMELEVETVLPGHGEPFGDLRDVAERRIAMHTRRARRILHAVDGHRTAHAIAAELWPELPVTHAYIVLCEVLGHLDLLAADGSVREEERDGLVVWAPAGVRAARAAA